ncbi:hypothetical protein AXF42_Ash011359 [Apostasia shenzhenica]|uniref:Uncharacterized protein n=1 Tax=Apostasia shenzhenica TaxID=1088818 RepID=A0A2I0AE99_9ASPA|nr:hypothetical protein AXF42_Ash011359 [Apostasia shenzhenica]
MALRLLIRPFTAGTNFSFFKALLPASRRLQNSSITGQSSEISSARSQAPILTLEYSGSSVVELGAAPSNSMELADPDLENGVGPISGYGYSRPHPTNSPANILGEAAADDGRLGNVKKAAKFVCSLTLSLFAGIVITGVTNMRKASKNGKELGFYKGSVGAAILGSASDVGLLVSILMEPARTGIDGEGLKKLQIRFMVVSVALDVVAIGLLGLNALF